MITALRFHGMGISASGSLLTGGAAAFPRNAVGFVHALERNLKRQAISLGENRRVAIGVENYSLHKGEQNPATPKMALWKPWKSRSEMAPSVLDYELKCDATITLIIDSDDLLDTEPLRAALKTEVPSLRFANGSIFVGERFSQVIPGSDGESLGRAIKAVRASRAQFMISRDELIDKGREFDSFADALALFGEPLARDDSDDSGEESAEQSTEVADSSEDPNLARKWHRQQAGWVVPLERGYQAVTTPLTGRPAARDSSVPSVVATPVLGLGEFTTARRLISNLDLKAFWHPFSDRAAGLYLFNASSFNS